MASRSTITHRRLLPIVAALMWLCAGAAQAQPVPGEISITKANGFARIVLRLKTDVEASAKLAGSVLILSFKRPVDVAVDRLNAGAPDYVSAARIDPDGMAIRIALAQQVKANLMPAGERLYLDLLPANWSGVPPGLPQEVVEELARRAREAERKARQQQQLAKWHNIPPIHVRVAKQPTFTRYVFEQVNSVGVASNHDRDRLSLVFDAPLKFDLADAQALLPPYVASIQPKLSDDTASVDFLFSGKVDVRSFREDNQYIVDVSAANMPAAKADPLTQILEATLAPGAPIGNAVPGAGAPQTVPPASPREDRPAPPARPADARTEPGAAPPAPPVPLPTARPQTSPALVKDEKAKVTPPEPARTAAAATSPAKDARHDVAAVKPAPDRPSNAVAIELAQAGNGVRLVFPFAAPTPAAVFRRADMLWLVFDTDLPLDLSALENDPSHTIRSATTFKSNEGRVVRLGLDRPRLASLAAKGDVWVVTVGDEMAEPTKALSLTRSIVGPTRASVVIPFDDPRHIHHVADPETGDTLLVVTALGPARGIVKPQDFVEFHALASTHGVAIEPIADDLTMQIAADKIVIGRPKGLTLSARMPGMGGQDGDATTLFDSRRWTADRDANFIAGQSRLIAAAAAAPSEQRAAERVRLARFYMAHGMYVEAKAVIDVALSTPHPKDEEAGTRVLRAATNVLCERPHAALRDLANPAVGRQHDAPLWRAMALAEQDKWPEANDAFRAAEVSIGTLPIELQRFALQLQARAAIEVGDLAAAAGALDTFETIGTPRELQPALQVLRGRLAERLGRTGDAIVAYRAAEAGGDRQAATQAELRETVLRMKTGELKRAAATAELETLSAIWRGDDIEVESLQMLARLYTKEGRIRDAFSVMRTALATHPSSDRARKIQDDAAATFDSLFLDGKADKMPPIEALSLFYDYRELTPMGRRGDEMIRRLADRLVSVDLLDQAGELLQHQVDHRLQGAARAQVATRLALIYLMNRKPDRALAVLQSTRLPDLSTELRNRRLLLEARALSDLGRHAVALEVVANVKGHEADRLRADILWAAQRWRKAAEQLERLHGDRWREFKPLDSVERTDILRAGIGYALGDDSLGLSRLRERYAAKMQDGADRRAFDVVTRPVGASGPEFRAVVRSIGSLDTFEGFLRDMRKRYPDLVNGMPAKRKEAVPPAPQREAAAEAKPAGAVAAPADQATTTGQAGSAEATRTAP